jgi:hypothetical protein
MKGKFASTLILLVGALALCSVTKAEGRGAIKLTVPFEFTVNGETLPAGTYTLSRVADDKLEGMILRNDTTRKSLFVHLTEVADAPSDKPEVSFERVGEAHFLNKIRTSYDVYDIPVDRQAVPEAIARLHRPRHTSSSSVGK